MSTRLFLLMTLCTLFYVSAQNKTITHNDYDLWKRISDTKISDSGKLVVSTIALVTERGDGEVQIYNTDTGNTFIFDRGYDTSISADENYVVFKRKPAYEAIRKEKKAKVKKDEQSKDDFFIYDVKNNSMYDSVNNVKAYKLPEKYEGWLVLEKFKEAKNKEEKKKGREVGNGKKANDSINEKKSDSVKEKVKLALKQNYALVYQFKDKSRDTIHQIKEFEVPKNGTTFLYSLKREKKKAWDLGIYTYDVAERKSTMLDTTQYEYSKLAVDEKATQFAFISSPDSTAVDSLRYELNFLKGSDYKVLVDSTGTNLKADWILGQDFKPYFSESGKRLYFGIKPEMVYNRDTTLLYDEIPQVDVWNWQDKLLQPEQKVKEKELKENAFLAYYDTAKSSYITLQEKTLKEIALDSRKEEKYLLANTNDPYALERSWAFPWKRDVYVVNSFTGENKLLVEGATDVPKVFPDNNFAIYFDMNAQDWFSVDLNTAEKRNLTEGLPVAFYDEDDDHPSLPYQYGFGGFDKEGDALVYDKFDIWKLSADASKAPINITKNGRLENIEYRLLNLNPEKRDLSSYLEGKLLVTSFDKTTKASGLYLLRKGKLIEKIEPNAYAIRNYSKAKEAEVFTFTKENFQKYPDLTVTKDKFKKTYEVTNLNPHEKEFKWGTVEQFAWTAFDGTKLDGLIYKPEDFDPAKKYPLITYFYEKRSDTYTRHVSPSPSRSTVNAAYLVSNDYVMFIPDIVYKDGQPGESAYNCIISGVEAVESLGYIDSANMALQGQSWGGYQVAYLVTKTNMFKAAMAGAPVSNMTSAYGGIRWGSGRSRAVQYERTQTRIGKDLWEGLDLYLENSPLFGIPNIETPLLMMHNDEDGAVPYYQGIEMFMGMRRLQKPAWLLVYNKEAHNLTKMKNRQDLSIRMMQFFDHYLKGAPAPKWMSKGLPRIDKEKDLGYELSED